MYLIIIILPLIIIRNGVSSSEAKFRLSGNLESSSLGRVEVQHNGIWGKVCSDNFGDVEANVFCKSLNYSGGVIYNGDFGVEGGTIWMDEIKCSGEEASLDQCLFNGWGKSNCESTHDVAVSCDQKHEQEMYRFADGSYFSGRIEVLHNSTWGTVCNHNNGFGVNEAKVFCRSIGLSGGALSSGNPGTGDIWMNNLACEELEISCFSGGILSSGNPGTGAIWMKNLACEGDEAYLHMCEFDEWENEACFHDTDVHVICDAPFDDTPSQGLVKLVDGKGPFRGVVLLFHDGNWGTICNQGIDPIDISVLCSSIGTVNGRIDTSQYPERTEPILLKDVTCNGTVDRIEDCGSPAWGEVSGCDHSQDLAIFCDPIAERIEDCGSPAWGEVSGCDHSQDLAIFSDPIAGNYRLVDGYAEHNGRVEVELKGKWGTICGDGFDNNAARVICQHLGLSGGTALSSPIYGQGIDKPIWGTNWNCSGTELGLDDCQFDGWGVNVTCSHLKDATVDCLPKNTEESRDSVHYRLTDGKDAVSGRLWVYVNGFWGTVCSDNFGEEDAKVACRSLGLEGGALLKPTKVDVPLVNGHIWMDEVRCTGEETRLADCSFGGWGVHNCWHYKDVYVECMEPPPPAPAAPVPTTPPATTSA